jgi:hypothetical protein
VGGDRRIVVSVCNLVRVRMNGMSQGVFCLVARPSASNAALSRAAYSLKEPVVWGSDGTPRSSIHELCHVLQRQQSSFLEVLCGVK